MGMRKTQPGPGDPLRIDRGDCGEKKGGQSTKRSSQTGARGEAAASSTGAVPETWGTGQGAGRTPTRACTVLDTVASEGPKRQSRSNSCAGVLRGGPSGERGSILPV